MLGKIEMTPGEFFEVMGFARCCIRDQAAMILGPPQLEGGFREDFYPCQVIGQSVSKAAARGQDREQKYHLNP